MGLQGLVAKRSAWRVIGLMAFAAFLLATAGAVPAPIGIRYIQADCYETDEWFLVEVTMGGFPSGTMEFSLEEQVPAQDIEIRNISGGGFYDSESGLITFGPYVGPGGTVSYEVKPQIGRAHV